MKIWIVMVNPAMGVRYVDSMWAREEAANDRLSDIHASFEASGNPSGGLSGHRAYIREGKVEDAKIAESL